MGQVHYEQEHHRDSLNAATGSLARSALGRGTRGPKPSHSVTPSVIGDTTHGVVASLRTTTPKIVMLPQSWRPQGADSLRLGCTSLSSDAETRGPKPSRIRHRQCEPTSKPAHARAPRGIAEHGYEQSSCTYGVTVETWAAYGATSRRRAEPKPSPSVTHSPLANYGLGACQSHSLTVAVASRSQGHPWRSRARRGGTDGQGPFRQELNLGLPKSAAPRAIPYIRASCTRVPAPLSSFVSASKFSRRRRRPS